MKRMNSLFKVVAVVMTIALCAPFLAACSGEVDDRETTHSSRETIDPSVPGIDEPDQSIVSSEPTETETVATSETTPAPQEGAYTYTVYAGTEYETTLSMDVDIDEWLYDVDWADVPFFSTGKLYKSLGWYTNGDPNYDSSTTDYGYCSYFYGDDTQAVFRASDNWSEEAAFGYPQIWSFTYHYAPVSNYLEDVYSDEDRTSDLYYGVFVKFMPHYDDLCYVTVWNGDRVALSRDDAIIIAYVYSFAINHPGENPFYGTPLANAEGSSSNNYIDYLLP